MYIIKELLEKKIMGIFFKLTFLNHAAVVARKCLKQSKTASYTLYTNSQ